MAAAASLPAPLLEKLLCDAMWIRVTLQVHWRHGETYVDEYRDVEGRFHVRREAMCKPGVLCRVEQWRPFIPSLTVRVEGDAVLIRLGQVGVRSRQVTIAVCRRWARAGAAALRSTWRLKVPERFVDVFDRGCATFMRVHAAHFDMVQLRKGVSAPMAACLRVRQGASYSVVRTKSPLRWVELRARAADFSYAAERKFLRRLLGRWWNMRMLGGVKTSSVSV